jgi:hypothetical protein
MNLNPLVESWKDGERMVLASASAQALAPERSSTVTALYGPYPHNNIS